MKILAVDIGTGTQDILLFDTRLDIENAYKLVLPAPTMIIYRQLQHATKNRRPVVLTGVTMGGGPSHWAAEEHLRMGLSVYATPDAARSFNDDLSVIEASGIRIISEDEVGRLPGEFQNIELLDFDFPAIQTAFMAFGIDINDLSAIAVSAFDHGTAPTDISDRQYRFDYLERRIKAENRLSAFAYLSDQLPADMARLQAVASSAKNCPAPLIIMDSAPAGVLGATFDPLVSRLPRKIIGNVGNFHTLAFRLGASGIEGVFEHHTGLLDLPRLETLLISLADGSLRHETVFHDHGHGAFMCNQDPFVLDPAANNLIITGPRRAMLRESRLCPYFAVPFGDMMMAGCIGLLAATADLLPDLRDPIHHALTHPSGVSRPPWE